MFDMPYASVSGNANDPPDITAVWGASEVSGNDFDQFMDSLLPGLGTAATGPQTNEASGSQSLEVANGVAPERSNSGAEKRARNNEAQKRHRERKREHSQQLEAQYAASTAELQELRQKQKSLEARNLLLEKLMQMNEASEPSTSTSSTADDSDLFKMWDRYQNIPEPFANVAAQSPLRLTVDKDRVQMLSLADITKISPPAFVKLHKDYTQALGMALMELQQDAGNIAALTRLQTLVLEWKQLMVSLVVSVPARIKELGGGSVMREPDQPPDFYLNLLITVEFTDSQIADILHLRRLLYCKQGQLARQRKALLNTMASVNVGAIEHVGEKFSQLTQCSTQLRQNGAEEYKIWVEFGAAYHAGIMTSEQTAASMVYAYPHWPKHGAIMEHLAKERGQPSMQELLDDTSVDDLQHAANWEEVVRYASIITMQTIHGHVPLLPA